MLFKSMQFVASKRFIFVSSANKQTKEPRQFDFLICDMDTNIDLGNNLQA